jgi:hypothetical protein
MICRVKSGLLLWQEKNISRVTLTSSSRLILNHLMSRLDPAREAQDEINGLGSSVGNIDDPIRILSHSLDPNIKMDMGVRAPLVRVIGNRQFSRQELRDNFSTKLTASIVCSSV